ncbi:glutamate carboxypeptidase [Silvibacterium bohemicum]|uniref:Glutamate carboxypeptidase n=1 Tax=Silvibacterium bohemicum TaxID=1577686 RepID=A0A841K072_9BACT|nr:M20 family metallopeptidase [Silvibacterium bohemicum]MBB6146956.1 glutamate carboxypeptidase [Silvibacterium bohemicum]
MSFQSITSNKTADSAEAQANLPELLKFLQLLVELESPSDDKAAVDRCVDLAAKRAESMGGRVRRHRQKNFGDLLEVRFGRRGRAVKPILLLGHLDTVWPIGTLAKMPFRIDSGRVWGPGVLDMKAGVAMAFAAIETLQQRYGAAMPPVVLLLVSEEEVGSPVSRAVTERIAGECAAVYVLEPAQGLYPGAYKTARKGVGHYRIHITGVAAHSGIDFASGHSAIAELAHQIEAIHGFTDMQRGITVNVGTIQGGTRSNVVAAEASAEVDVRVARKIDAARVDRQFRRLRARDKQCVLKVEGGLNRPPMERSRGTVALFKRAATLARAMGFDLQEAATGGGSDGNFTSALGIPTLDGMGAVGEGAHATHESLLLKDLGPRTALLAAMLMKPEE